MAVQSYDAVIVGAGHNGLVLAMYLQRAGLCTVVIERRHEEGGGVNTEEPVLPGFRHNMHAQYMEFFDIMPAIRDFGLEELGLRTIMPEAQAGITFADGRPPIILYRPDLEERTYESIACYSTADAELYCELKSRAQKLESVVAMGLYNAPVAGAEERQREITEQLYGDLGITSYHAAKTVKILIDELFETPELRALFYRASVEWGFPIDDFGVGYAFLTFIMWTLANWKLAVGGTHSFAKVLTQACYREGVDLIESSLVEKIIVEDGRAVGVIARGNEIRATKIVASNADLRQTLLDLVGPEHLSDTWVSRAKNFRYGPSHVLGTPMYCLYEEPKYRSARHNPDINRCFYTVVGYDSDDDMARYIRDAYSGRLPKPAAGTWVNTLWDTTQAPAGRHSATGWYFFPKASALTSQEWEDVRETFNWRFLDVWRRHAPNMTSANVIAQKLYTPDQQEHKNLMREGDFSNGEFAPDQIGANRPFPEASDYRTEIAGLYLCGPSAYPGGGVHGGCGYNSFKAIAHDLDLPSPARGRMY